MRSSARISFAVHHIDTNSNTIELIMASATAGRSAFSVIKSIPARYPLGFGAGVSCIKTSGSDLLVQKIVEQREEVDWKRNIAFGSFGLLYLGGVQYSLYVNIFQRIFPGAASFAAKPFAQKIRDVKGLGAMFGQVRTMTHSLVYQVQGHQHLTLIYIGLFRSMCSSSSLVFSSLLLYQRDCYEQRRP